MRENARLGTCLIFTTLTFVALPIAWTSALASTLTGDAVDLDSGQLLYTEVHTFSSNDRFDLMRSDYLRPDGRSRAEREITLSQGRVMNYTLKINGSAYQETVRRDKGSLYFETVSLENAIKRQSVQIDADEAPVIDAGMNNHILRNWRTLINGKRLRFNFASPARLGLVKLQVDLDKKNSTDDIAMFLVNTANPIFRLLIKPIKVGFYRQSRQLAFYQGISNLRDEEGDLFNIKIVFEDGQLPNMGQTIIP